MYVCICVYIQKNNLYSPLGLKQVCYIREKIGQSTKSH